ncbi:hypothetical protein BG36_22890 [Aquamicrobium defluvii]|uniref:Lipoprotein n=1 Tax=Aquamicrobium defluvii TaxID=69279 RepID=A0A011UTD3_9HYPH|nr:hypothetical protein BG36_22890 [Aquamicrobium defluvii]EZQ17329.1 hypothetical protein CF98_30875 [Halopseudomonas bauzanensis]
MNRHAIWIAPSFAALLAASGCSKTTTVSECDGWRKLTPSAETRQIIIHNDKPFAQGVAAHNTFGTKRGCWK